jgi:IS5 family transposase
MRDTIVSAVREAGILCRTATQMPRASKFIAQAFATAARVRCERPVSSKRPTPDDPSLLRARRRHLAWTERERILYASHRTRVEGVHGEEKAWHGLARAVRRGLANMKIQANLTAAAVNLKRLAVASRS